MIRLIKYGVIFLMALFLCSFVDLILGKSMEFNNIHNVVISIGCVLICLQSDLTEKIKSRRVRFISDSVSLFIIFSGVYVGIDKLKSEPITVFQLVSSLVVTIIVVATRAFGGVYKKVEE